MIIQSIHNFIKQHNLIPHKSTIILGISGGPDSIFLLHLLTEFHKQNKITLITAHLDHEWRPDSHKDVEFCKKITDQLGLEMVTKKISELTITFKWKGSKEEVGRKARRYFLEKVLQEHNADLIALAHHLQDQQETFFIRLIRGASLGGLTVMRPKHGVYIRPILEINKKDIVTYLQEHNIEYLTDPSNESPEFLRNRIRATVLPPLSACDKRFDKNFLVTLKRLQAIENFLEQFTQKTFVDISQTSNGELQLHIKKLFELHTIMQYRILMHWLQTSNVFFSPTQSFLDEILRFLSKPDNKSHAIHKQWKIEKRKHWVSIVQT